MLNKNKKDVNWRRLDNSAKIFPLSSSKKYSSVFRLSAVMKENINPKVLEEAVNIAINKYIFFKVKLKQGFFWYYFEDNPKKIKIEEEIDYPCKYIDPSVNNSYLFKITYFERKINIDIFHSLTDGNTAVQFFKEIVYTYIELMHPDKFAEECRTDRKISFDTEDSYLKNYDKKSKNNKGSKKAYILRGKKLPFNAIAVTHEIIDFNKLKEVAKSNDATITQYLTAALIYSIYNENYKSSRSKKPIKICVPVNLKKYFKSQTVNNFFSYITVETNFKDKKMQEFNNILNFVKQSFENKLQEQEIMKTMSANVKLGNNTFIKLIPLFLKKVFVKLSYIEIRKYTTTTFSNIGRIGIISKYSEYIDKFLFLIAPETVEKIKCSACSYEDKMIFTFTSILNNKYIENGFYEFLKSQGINVSLESNGV